MDYSLIQEKLKPLYGCYWGLCGVGEPATAKQLKTAIDQIVHVIHELLAENKRLAERSEETERLLMEAIRASRRNEPRR